MTSPYKDLGCDGLPPIRGRTPVCKELRLEDLEVITQSPTTSRRFLLELQEQLKSYREETKKKDELINKLASMEIKGNPNKFLDASIGAGISAQNTRGELAALQVKVETLNNHLREKTVEVEQRDEQLNALKRETEQLREDNARLVTITGSLTQQLEEHQSTEETFTSLKNRNEFAITTLQQQYREASDHVADLEGRIRVLLEEREKVEQCKGTVEKGYSEFLVEVSHLISYYCQDGEISKEAVLQKLADMNQDNAAMKSRLVTLTETLAGMELEQKANRETIMRLVAELGKESQDTEAHVRSREDLLAELQRLARDKEESGRQMDLMEQRWEASQRILKASSDELEEAKARLARLDCERREYQFQAGSTNKQLQAFIDNLASILSSCYSQCPPTEDAIKERIRTIATESQEHKAAMECMENRLRTVTHTLESKVSRGHDLHNQASVSHTQFLDFKERIRILENELASSDVLRDSLRADKEKFFRYMQKLAEVMKMDKINSDIGFDMIGEGLVARAEQLSRLEADTLADRCTTIYNLKRKLKQCKEQLESKDLHLDLLRKKMASLEDKIHGKSDVEKEKDEETQKTRRLAKQVEKMQRQCEELRTENVSLKAQLLECSNLKITAIEQDKEIQSLERTMEKLERVRQKQAKKILDLKSEVDDKEKVVGDSRALSENTVQALSNELRTTKQALDDTRRKEKQMLEFRSVIGRMLGLDVDALAIPDYDIINRLERLVQAHQSNVYTAYSTEKTLYDLDQGFRAGEEAACRAVDGMMNHNSSLHNHNASANNNSIIESSWAAPALGNVLPPKYGMQSNTHQSTIKGGMANQRSCQLHVYQDFNKTNSLSG